MINLPYTGENDKPVTLPYRPGTDDGFTKFPRIIEQEVPGEKGKRNINTVWQRKK